MEAKLVVLCHDIEEKGICVIVERLVVQKHLGYQTQVLGISLCILCVPLVKRYYEGCWDWTHLVFSAVYFKEGYCVFSVDLISRWMTQVAFCLQNFVF